jgi:zinc/manganese transport system substrate-binding protein
MLFRFARRDVLGSVATAALMFGGIGSYADEPLDVVATFSILADMTAQVGGDRINLVTLVRPDEDAHVFFPEPSHARALAEADLVLVNGLGFEGWMDRLVSASGYEGPVVTASEGIVLLSMDEEHHDDEHEEEEHAHDDEHGDEEHAHGDEHEEDEHAHGDEHGEEEHAGLDEGDDHYGHDHGDTDPHAWQDLANARVYVVNITAALISADPDGRAIYEANSERYLAELEKLEVEIHAAMDTVPESHRTVVTNHDAFGYFGRAYDITFLAPEGLSTEDEPSAAEMAGLIRQIREENVTAVFIENIADNRVIEQIVAETDASIGGTLYSDALSKSDGPASTYLEMMRHNALSLTAAMQAF